MADNFDQFVDVDFSRETDRLGFSGFGNVDRYASYEAAEEPIPQRDWQRLIEAQEANGGGADALVTRIYNQGREGSCVANATSQAIEIILAKMFGRDNVTPLSAISLYKRIGSSPGSGARLGDALREIESRGILPLNTPENRAKFGDAVMPATGFYTKFPTNWEATSKRFRASEWLVGRSFEGMVSASIRARPIVYARSGHCICGVRFVYRNGKLHLKYANSWGDWGDNGYGYDSEGVARRASGYFFCPTQIVVSQ